MIKAFLDLGINVGLMITNDNYIAVYEDFDYHDKVLDIIYSKLTGLGISELNVIMHGDVFCDKTDTVVELLNSNISESKSDYDAIKHLASVLGITKVFFYEFASYYTYKLPNNTLIVKQDEVSYKLLVYKDLITKAVICTDGTLQQNVTKLCNQYELTNIRNADTYFEANFLGYYKNVKSIDCNEIFPRLSLFAFTETKNCGAIKLLDKDFGNYTDTSVIEDEDKAASLIKATKDKKEKKTHKKSLGLRILAKLKLPLTSVLIVFIVGCYLTSFILSKKLSAEQKTLAQLSTNYITSNNQLTSYNRISNSGEISGSSAAINALDELDFSQADDVSISLNNGVLTTVSQFSNRTLAVAFKRKARSLNIDRTAKVSHKDSSYVCKLNVKVSD